MDGSKDAKPILAAIELVADRLSHEYAVLGMTDEALAHARAAGAASALLELGREG